MYELKGEMFMKIENEKMFEDVLFANGYEKKTEQRNHGYVSIYNNNTDVQVFIHKYNNHDPFQVEIFKNNALIICWVRNNGDDWTEFYNAKTDKNIL